MLIDNNFKKWVEELSQNYKRAQIKAAIHVNSELLHFYLKLGEEISNTSFKSTYGNQFYHRLSMELRFRLPNVKGLSERNLRYIYQFYTMYKPILQQVVAKLEIVPWGHHILIMDRCDSIEKSMFYVNLAIKKNLSRNELDLYIDSFTYERSLNTINNFKDTLPKSDKELAIDIIKDPYKFDFLELRKEYDEKDLKKQLIKNIRDFLIELGDGFAYLGDEYRLLAGNTELFCDMLFYHVKLHSYVVVELKTGDFKPEFMGQLAGYVGTIDNTIKSDKDNQTIGLLICKSKDTVLAKYTMQNAKFPIGISEYQLAKILPAKFKHSMPTIEEIENHLKKKEK